MELKIICKYEGALASQTVPPKINIAGKDSMPCCVLLDTGSNEIYLMQKIAEKPKKPAVIMKPIVHETII